MHAKPKKKVKRNEMFFYGHAKRQFMVITGRGFAQ